MYVKKKLEENLPMFLQGERQQIHFPFNLFVYFFKLFHGGLALIVRANRINEND